MHFINFTYRFACITHKTKILSRLAGNGKKLLKKKLSFIFVLHIYLILFKIIKNFRFLLNHEIIIFLCSK